MAGMLLARGDTPKGRLISARAFDRFAKPALDDYGYGIDVQEGGRVLAHGGSIAGFQAYLAAYPADGFAVVFLGNGPADKPLRDRNPRPPVTGGGRSGEAGGGGRREAERGCGGFRRPVRRS
jgi:CubicO group peptidase (beta-lactamase class C family)